MEYIMAVRIEEGLTKVCSECQQEKNIDDFWLHPTKRKDGTQRHRSKCKQCEIKSKLNKYHNEGGKEQQAKRSFKNLMNKYGITPEIYEQERKNQDFKCALCGKHESTQHHNRLYVDHCHSTGLYRGLLCNTCNCGLGSFNDNIELMKKAIEYVENNRNRHREQLCKD